MARASTYRTRRRVFSGRLCRLFYMTRLYLFRFTDRFMIATLERGCKDSIAVFTDQSIGILLYLNRSRHLLVV